MADLDMFKAGENAMIVKVEDTEYRGAQGPFTISDIDIYSNTVTLKETDTSLTLDGISEINKDGYLFLTPVIEAVKLK